MNSINYYKKYSKYKNKYLEIKNNLIGAGENGTIRFIEKIGDIETVMDTEDENFLQQLEQKLTIVKHGSILNIKIKEIILVLRKDNGTEIRFKIIKLLSDEGVNGVVYLLDTDKIIKLSKRKGVSMVIEAKDSDILNITKNSKALYQGELYISFVIYNYLGEELKKYLESNTIELDLLFVYFLQLFEQIYELNFNQQYHNDVKIQNCVILCNNLSLIDFGFYRTYSYNGSYVSLCIKGYVNLLKNKFNKELISNNLDDCIIEYLLENCVSTDIVGFFNFVIDCLLLNYKLNIRIIDILYNLLLLNGDYSFEDLIKMLCFLSIVSFNKKPYNMLLTNPYCCDIIEKIEKNLFIHYDCTTQTIKKRHNNQGIFCYTCLICKYLNFNTDNQFTFIFNLVKKCLNSTFNLEDFKRTYHILFTESLIK